MRWQPEIGNSIRVRRQHWGLTQEKFAAKLGVTFPSVNHWENNRGTPCPVPMEKIEGMLRSLLPSPSVTLRELSSSIVSK
ncbi:MAG: helix-turn-helix transcriptional regulator, partial [Coleofasciculus sp. C3-bin4]|nr:helix-turn-helix transcriptional regulator [Coleofasciculus sp. C3-bin4]